MLAPLRALPVLVARARTRARGPAAGTRECTGTAATALWRRSASAVPGQWHGTRQSWESGRKRGAWNLDPEWALCAIWPARWILHVPHRTSVCRLALCADVGLFTWLSDMQAE